MKGKEEENAEEAIGKCEAIRIQILRWYSNLLTANPWIILLLTVTVVVWALLNGFIKELGAKPLPDFSLPSKGFEPRGTVISRRIVAYNNLDRILLGIPLLATSSRRPDPSSYTPNSKKASWCSLDPRSYLSAKTVYKSVNGDSLFNETFFRAVCKLEADTIRRRKSFTSYCERAKNTTTDCCPSISIGSLVAVMFNRTTCENITRQDVHIFRDMLRMCKPYIDNGNITDLCLASPAACSSVPKQCLIGNIIPSVFYYMVDKDFSATLDSTSVLTYTIAFSPLIHLPNELLKQIYYDKLSDLSQVNSNGVKLVAYEFTGMKNLIYDKRLLVDIWYVLSAMFLVIFLMWMYSGSIILSLMGFTTVIFALILSYWIYSIIFQLRFFPFLNIMTAIFIVGIGADDVFVYVLAWRHAREMMPQSNLEFRASLKSIMAWTEYALEHAAAAMFVTSFTTATAFYAGVSSDITALQCFSIFAGTSIMTNYLLMLTWFPAMMVIHQKYFTPIWCSHPRLPDALPGIAWAKQKTGGVDAVRDRVILIRERLKGLSDIVFGYWVGRTVVRLRHFWIFFFLLLAVLGIICITVYPKLQLPTSQMFPLFVHRHSLEQYDFKIKDKLQIDSSLASERIDFPVIFVWGVQDKDKGYFLDPDNTGSSVWDSKFDVMNPEAQNWTLQFCKSLRKQSFYREGSCFMELFHAFAQQNCTLNPGRKCCDLLVPLNKQEFRTCAKEYLNEAQRSGDVTLKLDMNGNIKLMLFRFSSNYKYQFKFTPVDTFWSEIKAWSDKMMATAPPGMKDGWVISDLYFYDLQRSLADGTIKTIGISIAISAMVLFVTTQNVIVTLFAVVTISGIISVTIGTLVLSGWKLNILESMTMSVAVGLSIDFTLHYGVAYFVCPDSRERKDRVQYSLWHVGSAVAMGTVTTFLTGLVMMPSVIYAYIQIGHFLMLVMSMSWLFATFFFLSLTALLGPQGDLGDIIKCWKSNQVKTDQSVETEEEPETEDVQKDLEPMKRPRSHHHHGPSRYTLFEGGIATGRLSIVDLETRYPIRRPRGKSAKIPRHSLRPEDAMDRKPTFVMKEVGNGNVMEADDSSHIYDEVEPPRRFSSKAVKHRTSSKNRAKRGISGIEADTSNGIVNPAIEISDCESLDQDDNSKTSATASSATASEATSSSATLTSATASEATASSATLTSATASSATLRPATASSATLTSASTALSSG